MLQNALKRNRTVVRAHAVTEALRRSLALRRLVLLLVLRHFRGKFGRCSARLHRSSALDSLRTRRTKPAAERSFSGRVLGFQRTLLAAQERSCAIAESLVLQENQTIRVR